MNQSLWQFPGGIHPPQHKRESTQKPIASADLPAQIILPLHQHIGEESQVDVKPGQRVLAGQRLAKAHGYVSVSLHASTSGTVREIDEFPVAHPSGLKALAIVLDVDGKDEWIERKPIQRYEEEDPSHLRNLIREAGIVGLGGAGFPSFIKLNPRKKNIDLLILNGIECEPYITCDDMLMREQAREIIAGANIIRHALQAQRVVIAIEDNKPEALRQMREAVEKTSIEIVVCPTIYPQGSEKQLIKVVTGKEVPANGLPIDVGVIVHNVGTARAIHRAIELGEPLVSRIVTVTGSGVTNPGNFETRLGSSMQFLIDQAGGLQEPVERILMGGPMMGFALHTTDVPVVKTTNCILALQANEFAAQSAPILPCIRCGACADACPVSLLPQQLYWHTRAGDFEKTQEYSLFDCIECGCCAYVCPSNIPLVHYYRFAKSEIWAREREKEQSDVARQRHEFRQFRLERDKQERAERQKRKRAELTSAAKNPNAPSPVEAAAQRAREKKQQKSDTGQAQSDTTLPQKESRNKQQ